MITMGEHLHWTCTYLPHYLFTSVENDDVVGTKRYVCIGLPMMFAVLQFTNVYVCMPAFQLCQPFR